MSVHTIFRRIVTKRIGGIFPSTSAGIVLSIPSASLWTKLDRKHSFSDDVSFDVAAELQGHPLIRWFDRSMKTACGHAQNLVENSGLSNTPLEHLGLYTWWKPSSWYRVFLEYLHTNYELSWLATIICATISIRIATLYLPTLILWKRTRFENVQLPFLHQTASRIGSTLLYSLNFGLFLTQYCAVRKMAEVVYPNWTTSGMLSFVDLTVPDSAFLLPTLTAVCFTFSSKKWIETLRMQKTVSNWMLGLKPDNTIYPIAACSFFVASNVPSSCTKVVCIYWIASSLISGVHATVLTSSAVRSLLRLPDIYSDPIEIRRAELLRYVSEMRRRRACEVLQFQNRAVEIEKKSQENGGVPELLVKEGLQGDSLFRRPLMMDTALSSSKIAKLMEQYVQEAARADVMRKAGKLDPVNKRKLEIDKITAG